MKIRDQRSEIRGRSRGFTLIEIMVVVAIMGMILAMGIPSIYRMSRREGMRRAVNDVMEVCSHARAQAILHGKEVELTFYPEEKRFGVGAAPSPERDDGTSESTPAAAATSLSGALPEDVRIEELWLNGQLCTGSDWTWSWVPVRFFPNGTSDELRILLVSTKNERKLITLEVTTGLVSAEEIQ